MKSDICPCCGAPAMTDSELRIVLCLHAAGKPLEWCEIERVTGITARSIKRITATRPHSFDVKRGREQYERSTVSLSARGKLIATQLAGDLERKAS